jgi:hypothetical protein
VTRPKRPVLPKHSLAGARALGVCLDLHKHTKTAPEIFTDEAISHPCTVVSALPYRFSISQGQSKPHVRTTKVDSIPIALPRPPQTRAASFKRLYPK